MEKIILRQNATTVYRFLSLIQSENENETLKGKKILDCGAGGILPPLALFSDYGFELFGIDISEEQVELGKQFFEEKNIKASLRVGDMMSMPFEDESFDYVYEHYSMCHLNKKETQKAIDEMHRVLKKGGMCFLGGDLDGLLAKGYLWEGAKSGRIFWH